MDTNKKKAILTHAITNYLADYLCGVTEPPYNHIQDVTDLAAMASDDLGMNLEYEEEQEIEDILEGFDLSKIHLNTKDLLIGIKSAVEYAVEKAVDNQLRS